MGHDDGLGGHMHGAGTLCNGVKQGVYLVAQDLPVPRVEGTGDGRLTDLMHDTSTSIEVADGVDEDDRSDIKSDRGWLD
jgi:hypothetical protein